MKRSEMLKLIRERLLGKSIALNFEEQILKIVEDAGMLPPIESNRTVHDLDLGVPEWESENESSETNS